MTRKEQNIKTAEALLRKMLECRSDLQNAKNKSAAESRHLSAINELIELAPKIIAANKK